MQIRLGFFLQLPWSAETHFTNIPAQKAWFRGMDPTHPHNQVENATAPSAGGSSEFVLRVSKETRSCLNV
jgi:hypothetical protein